MGAAFVTEGIIYSHLIGNDIGCFISLFQTSTLEKKFKIDKVMKNLSNLEFENISDKDDFNIGAKGKYKSLDRK